MNVPTNPLKKLRVLDDGSIAEIVWDGGELLPNRPEHSKQFDSDIAWGNFSNKPSNRRTVKVRKMHEAIQRRLAKRATA